MKLYLSLFFSIFLFVSCSNDADFEPETEADILQYLENNNLNATKTSSGLYYVINNEGTGARPTSDSFVTVDFKAYFLDGTVFDQSDSTGVSFGLNQIIEGLKEGIQLFKEGGDGILLIPANLAYGSAGSTTIPGDTVLVFDIKLIKIIDYDAQNEADILHYIEDNNLEAQKSDSGLYYVINEEGTGTTPTSNSNVTVAYKGYFLDGTVFDESDGNGISIGLNQVILGWQEGITYFKEGGEGVLLIPSSLAYGNNGSGPIPGGAVLVFDVKLISVN